MSTVGYGPMADKTLNAGGADRAPRLSAAGRARGSLTALTAGPRPTVPSAGPVGPVATPPLAQAVGQSLDRIGSVLRRIRRPRFQMGPVRVLPITLAAVFLMFSIKVSDVWQGLSEFGSAMAISSAVASPELPAATPAANPAGQPAATASAASPVATAAAQGSVQVASLGSASRDPSRFSQSEIDLLQALAGRRDALDTREKQLDEREAMLHAAELSLQQKVTELDTVKAQLQGMLAKQNEQEDGRLKTLVRIYEAMKPKDAAQIFDKLDIPVVLGVVSRMKEAKVAPILASMEPERAKEVTAKLADRVDGGAQGH